MNPNLESENLTLLPNHSIETLKEYYTQVTKIALYIRSAAPIYEISVFEMFSWSCPNPYYCQIDNTYVIMEKDDMINPLLTGDFYSPLGKYTFFKGSLYRNGENIGEFNRVGRHQSAFPPKNRTSELPRIRLKQFTNSCNLLSLFTMYLIMTIYYVVSPPKLSKPYSQ